MYPDCQRRHAARAFTDDVKSAGYEIATVPPSIGAIIGSGSHAGIGLAMSERVEGREASAVEIAERVNAEIDERMGDGKVVWDDTTGNIDVARQQALRQARSILDFMGHRITPVGVEEYFQADLGEGFTLSGHVDTREIDAVIDYKTGTIQRANGAQYGGYSLLVKANGHRVDRLTEIFAKRVGTTKPQPEPIMVNFDLVDSEKAAWSIAQTIKRDLIKFRATGDPWSFTANPNSMNCSPNYCPAWGSQWCKSHRKGTENE
jgi:hypothetical protein